LHPPIAPSGLYWVAPVTPSNLTVSADGATMMLEMRDIHVIDQPKWPALDAVATPARMTFRIVWRSTSEPAQYENPAQQFRFTGTRASCQLEAEITVPSIGFTWKSDPLETSHADFAIIGEEVNGRYYDGH
jgi:hypothetical protein